MNVRRRAFLASFAALAFRDPLAPRTAIPSIRPSAPRYAALACVIQLTAQQPYLRFMRERIFDPAGMSNTWLDFMRRPDAARATGYFWDWSGWTPSRARTTTMGAGGIQSHVLDLARWDAALRADAILTAESKRAMWSPFRWKIPPWRFPERREPPLNEPPSP